ncbi:VOC family protein [Halioxenophilus sp. WMMB6]|uniref:VOC family protein n=1 Tax=Halioxenophilus sp. WMMB6 TaxID=3073815 RepID=UPI00295ED971|nr:VOC family protein [Halioxenophilus sp. WMMB6]
MTTELKTLNNINHAAYRCRDAEQTRWFYEDVLGLPLQFALVEEIDFGLASDKGQARKYMHLFFLLGDGNYIAFFDQPDVATEEHFTKADSFDRHLALQVNSYAELEAWKERIQSHGKSCLGPWDHGFCDSIYMYDPNGLQVEVCCLKENAGEIIEKKAAVVKEVLAQWTKDTRAIKEQRFGKAALDMRGKDTTTSK